MMILAIQKSSLHSGSLLHEEEGEARGTDDQKVFTIPFPVRTLLVLRQHSSANYLETTDINSGESEILVHEIHWGLPLQKDFRERYLADSWSSVPWR